MKKILIILIVLSLLLLTGCSAEKPDTIIYDGQEYTAEQLYELGFEEGYEYGLEEGFSNCLEELGIDWY